MSPEQDMDPVEQTTSALPAPAGHEDDLASVVVRRLERHAPAGSWGLLKTLILGIPSFGLIPLLAWPARFQRYAATESQALEELAQWSKLRGRQPAAIGPLLAAAEDTAAGPLTLVLSLVLSGLLVGLFAIQFAHVPFTLDTLMVWTYSHRLRMQSSPPLPRGEFLYRAWVAALSIGYGVQWLNVRAHAADVRCFVSRFNPIAEAEMLPPVQIPRAFIYGRPMWLLTAVLLACHGAWWGIPMVLAGMAQRRYTNVTGKRVRHELSRRVKDIVTMRRQGLPLIAVQPVRCHNRRCLAVMRPEARFCSRCGSTAQGERRA